MLREAVVDLRGPPGVADRPGRRLADGDALPGSFARRMFVEHDPPEDGPLGGVRRCTIAACGGRTMLFLVLNSQLQRPGEGDDENAAGAPWLLECALGFGDGVKARIGEGLVRHGHGTEFEFPSQPGGGEAGGDTFEFRPDIEFRPSEQFDALLQRLCNLTAEDHAQLVGGERQRLAS